MLPDDEERRGRAVAGLACRGHPRPRRRVRALVPGAGLRRPGRRRADARRARLRTPRRALLGPCRPPQQKLTALPEPKEGRLRLLRALRPQSSRCSSSTKGLWNGQAVHAVAGGQVRGHSPCVWRLEGEPPPTARGRTASLIADGHQPLRDHALAFHEQDGAEGGAWLRTIVVPTQQEGLTIFPTHRLARDINVSCCDVVDGEPLEPFGRGPWSVLYRRGW